MKRKRIKKEKIDVTFGSDSRDDEFYIELRKRKKDMYSFLSLATQGEEIEVYIGKGSDTIIMNLSDLELLLDDSRKRLEKAKAEWKKTLEENPDWE